MKRKQTLADDHVRQMRVDARRKSAERKVAIAAERKRKADQKRRKVQSSAVQAFIRNLLQIYRKHGMSLGSASWDCNLMVEDWKKENANELTCAEDWTSTLLR